MDKKKSAYDLVVIGAGPGGSIAASTAAEKGLKVLLAEKRQEIGAPVRCGEMVSKDALSKFIRIDRKWVSAEVKWAKIYLPSGKEIVQKGDDDGHGLVLDRKLFDRHLVRLAAAKGVEVSVKTLATGLKREPGGLVSINLKRGGEQDNVKSKIVIGADGIESRVGKWVGIDTTLELDEIGSGIQYLVTDVNFDPEGSYFWYGKEIAPGGYAWLFPKGDKEANVGVGVIPKYAKKSSREYLDDFIRNKFGKVKIIELVAGGIPMKGPIETAVADNVMLVGDAARHTDPFTGSGIIHAMKGGFYSGKVASKAIERGDFSKEFLKKYDECWKNDFGELLQKNRANLEKIINLV
ncbi:MAG: geranylgeranyl reductase family protein [Halobacteriota archaeon]